MLQNYVSKYRVLMWIDIKPSFVISRILSLPQPTLPTYDPFPASKLRVPTCCPWFLCIPCSLNVKPSLPVLASQNPSRGREGIWITAFLIAEITNHYYICLCVRFSPLNYTVIISDSRPRCLSCKNFIFLSLSFYFQLKWSCNDHLWISLSLYWLALIC